MELSLFNSAANDVTHCFFEQIINFGVLFRIHIDVWYLTPEFQKCNLCSVAFPVSSFRKKAVD